MWVAPPARATSIAASSQRSPKSLPASLGDDEFGDVALKRIGLDRRSEPEHRKSVWSRSAEEQRGLIGGAEGAWPPARRYRSSST